MQEGFAAFVIACCVSFMIYMFVWFIWEGRKAKRREKLFREMWTELDMPTTQEKKRIDAGVQCPECFGVRVETTPRTPHDPYQYQCQECGCQWTKGLWC